MPVRRPDQMAYPSVDIYARLYDANGNPQSDEFLVNTDSNPCANPAVAAGIGRRFHDGLGRKRHDQPGPTVWTFTRAHSPARARAAAARLSA